MKSIRTRFAPSPTGSLHVGGVRTALFSYLAARRSGGSFVLRIEDTDRTRSTQTATQGILNDLAWTKIDWDEGPFFQSKRLPIYTSFVEILLDKQIAYEAWETPEELQALRSQHGPGFVYKQILYSEDQIARFRDEKRQPVVRLKVRPGPISFNDIVLGSITVDSSSLGDFVIRKSDGYPVYHFAVAVDDHEMEIDLVIRGQEHVTNTPRQILILEALGWKTPQYAHVPLIQNPNGTKMSKRDKPRMARAAAQTHHGNNLATLAETTNEKLQAFLTGKNDDLDIANALAKNLDIPMAMIEIADFRRAGFLPEALLNYLALLGWSPGDNRELLTREDLISLFTIDRVGTANCRFDYAKLEWMNAQYIRSQPLESLLDSLRRYAVETNSPLATWSDSRLRTLLQMYQPRINTWQDLCSKASFFWIPPQDFDPKAVRKYLQNNAREILSTTLQQIASCDPWNTEEIEQYLRNLTAVFNIGFGKIAQPIRIALCGNAASPSLFEIMTLLGREECLARISHLLDTLPHEDCAPPRHQGDLPP